MKEAWVVVWKHSDNSGFGVVGMFSDPIKAAEILQLLRDQYSGREYGSVKLRTDCVVPEEIQWGAFR